MSFAVRRAWVSDLDALVAAAVEAQADPHRHSAHLGQDAASIAADLTAIDGVDDWTQATHVALDDRRRVIGWLASETDADLGRVWWWGPFLADGTEELRDPIVDALFVAGERALDGFEEHEFAIDERAVWLRTFAERHGFAADEGSVVLNTTDMSTPGGDASDVAVVPLDGEHHAEVAELHDAIFPGTHTPGALLAAQTDERHDRFVALVGGVVVGYVATQIESDGSLYIDYVGVAVSQRGSGVGRALLVAAMRERQAGATHAHLTVRASNAAARRVYASLGFTEERVLIPLRRGFTLI